MAPQMWERWPTIRVVWSTLLYIDMFVKKDKIIFKKGKFMLGALITAQINKYIVLKEAFLDRIASHERKIPL